LAATGLIDKIKEIAGSIKAFFQPAIDWLVNAFNTVKDKIVGFFTGIGRGISNFFTPIISAVTGFFQRIFSSIHTFVKPMLDWFAEKWLQIVSFFKDNAIINAIKTIGGILLSGLLAPIQGLLEILSYIPGLGHLAGKGANKIQEFRNFLTGVEVVAQGEVTHITESPIPEDMTTMQTPDFGTFGFSSYGMDTGTGGRSPFHGVVDISGNTPMAAFADSTRTITSGGVPASGAISQTETINRCLAEITAILRQINSGVAGISTRNGDAPTYGTAPVTQAERMIYSVEEYNQRLRIEVAAERGTSARVVSVPKDADIRLVHSGGNA